MQAITVIVFAFGVATVRAAPACSYHELDKDIASVFFYAQNTTATTDPKIVAYDCGREKIAIKNLDEFASSSCVSGIAQGILKLVLEGATLESMSKCDPKNPRNQEYYKYVPCLNKNGVKVNKCFKDSVKRMEASAKAPVKQRVPHMCCNIHSLTKCIEDAAGEKCDKNHRDYVNSIQQSLVGDMLDTICSKYKPGSSNCKNLPTLKSVSTPKYMTVVPAIIEVLQTL